MIPYPCRCETLIGKVVACLADVPCVSLKTSADAHFVVAYATIGALDKAFIPSGTYSSAPGRYFSLTIRFVCSRVRVVARRAVAC